MTQSNFGEIPEAFSSSHESQHVDSCHEVIAVLSEIDERVGPRSLVVVAIVSEDSQAEIRERWAELSTKLIFVETEHSYTSRIHTLTNNTETRYRLTLVVSPKIESLSVQIPSQFRRLEIVACTKERTFLQSSSSHPVKELILEEDSTYCNIVLAQWSSRTTFPSHELVTCPGVMMELPDDGVLDAEPQPPPFSLNRNEDVDTAAAFLEKEMSSASPPRAPKNSSNALPWISGLTGAAAGIGTAGFLLVTSVKIGAKGLFISVGPYSAGWVSVSATGTLAAAGGVAASGVVAGAAVAAAIYFIPWAKLGSWLLEAFDHFLFFLKSIWSKIKEALGFLKKILQAILDVLRAARSGVVGLASTGLSVVGRWVTGSRPNGPIQLS